MDIKTAQDEEDEDFLELTSSTTGNRGTKNGSTRGRGGGARGGKTPNNNGKTPLKDQRPVRSVEQSRDADGIHNYQQSADGKLVINHRGHPLCNYCGIPSHERAVCRHRLRDVKNGLVRNVHPARGNIPSGNQARKEIQSKIASSADQWGDQWMQPHIPPPGSQGPQWPTTQTNPPAPMTVTITDPEDQKWLAQATSLV